MRVQLLTTLRGTQKEKSITWIKGEIFDSSEKPIPKDILHAVKTKSPSVLVLGDSLETSGKLEVELESAKKTITELKGQIDKLREELDTGEPATEKFLCPVPGCGKEVRSERGLKAHLTQMHPEYQGGVGEGEGTE